MKIRTAATAALALATVLTLAGCASSGGSDSGSMPGMDHGSTRMPSASSSASADFNGADVMFAAMMIPHHEQAVEMADVILAKEGIDEQVVTLAEDIKAAQQPEIDQMEGWLEEWGTGMPDMDDMGHGGGMMGDDDMTALQGATATEASRLFLEQMITHHEGAIEMAQDEINNGQNADAIEMAQNIVDSQTAEIAIMQDLLTQL
ncbi:DUF305 domain-containing protein [Microbacterium trichothecenolyticum]|uniref:DUF305 domain-containing protein n=1 Tax=Microbacterium ureisolvens TaxID=2781186 RepID=A0ABS7I1L3_9MICO|nr:MULTISPECIES: DUF305 domain-containing protein [Microbacterium]MBW9111547.1 DUF305 domain-containing protein [Microbacterium ureisolvens]MBW9121789.1 DUF305 domain-containing protein [Microbacterium trichothecenolyticum]